MISGVEGRLAGCWWAGSSNGVRDLWLIGCSDCNSRKGNKEREIRAGSKISRPEWEKAGNGKVSIIYAEALKLPFSNMLDFILPQYKV